MKPNEFHNLIRKESISSQCFSIHHDLLQNKCGQVPSADNFDDEDLCTVNIAPRTAFFLKIIQLFEKIQVPNSSPLLYCYYLGSNSILQF